MSVWGFRRVGLVFMRSMLWLSCLEFMPPPRSGLWSKKECNLPNGIDDVAAAFTKTFIRQTKGTMLTPGLLSRTIEYNGLGLPP